MTTNSPAVDRHDSNYLGTTLKAIAVGVLICAPIAAAGGWTVYGSIRDIKRAQFEAWKASQAYEELAARAPDAQLPVQPAAHGRDVFQGVCSACHGKDGKGLEGLGWNLVESDFLARQNDTQLRDFIHKGRPDARPVAMPPKGGREDLTDQDVQDVAVYLRGLQDPRRLPALPAPVALAIPETKVTDADKAAALQAAGGDAELAGYIAHGNKLFHSLCVTCHGKGGVGIQGNGKALVKNEFIKSLDDDKLLAFIQQGRAPTDPKNTTGIQMPPKGGNPAMSEDDILDIISFLRTLQGTPAPAAQPGAQQSSASK